MMPGRERDDLAMGATMMMSSWWTSCSTEGLTDEKSMMSQSCHIKMIQYMLA